VVPSAVAQYPPFPSSAVAVLCARTFTDAWETWHPSTGTDAKEFSFSSCDFPCIRAGRRDSRSSRLYTEALRSPRLGFRLWVTAVSFSSCTSPSVSSPELTSCPRVRLAAASRFSTESDASFADDDVAGFDLALAPHVGRPSLDGLRSVESRVECLDVVLFDRFAAL